ncbi:MAG: nuclear transport factor 2 family protein [Rhodanobacteraceae bacterium]|nr:nuclear transport factor 2 family protein [Rhodanobacteraceae bacterium]
MRSAVKSNWLILCGLLAALLLAGCSRDPSEQALRDTIEALEIAGEERKVGDFMDHVAEDFAGNAAEYDRPGLQNLLRLVALQHQRISVVTSGMQIEMHGDRALVRMRILVTGGGGLIPDSGQLFDTESGWRFVDGEWQLGSASWKPAQ